MAEERGDLFGVAENQYANCTVNEDTGGKVHDLFVDENGGLEYLGVKMHSLGPKSALILVDTSSSKERGEGALLDSEETTPELDQRLKSLFGVASDGSLEMLSADWIVPFLLVCLRDRNRYGRELTRKMIDLGFGMRRAEAIYRALRQMEKEGVVVSVPIGHGLSRRRYSITESGEAYLEYLANAFARYRKEMDLFLRAYNEQHTPESRSRSARASGQEERGD